MHARGHVCTHPLPSSKAKHAPKKYSSDFSPPHQSTRYPVPYTTAQNMCKQTTPPTGTHLHTLSLTPRLHSPSLYLSFCLLSHTHARLHRHKLTSPVSRIRFIDESTHMHKHTHTLTHRLTSSMWSTSSCSAMPSSGDTRDADGRRPSAASRLGVQAASSVEAAVRRGRGGAAAGQPLVPQAGGKSQASCLPPLSFEAQTCH
jgi:hypothetical protein